MNITVKKNSSGKPKLIWDSLPDVDHYQIFRANSEKGPFSKQFETTKPYYTNLNAIEGEIYYYKILPIYTSGKTGTFSQIVSSDITWVQTLTNNKKNARKASVPETQADSFEYIEYEDGIAIQALKSPTTNVVIPAFINNHPVKYILEAAFFDNTSIESVILPNSIISIGKQAFKGCINLTDVTFSFGLEVIPESCFEDCTSLQNVELPCTLLQINRRAFKKCTSLKLLCYRFGKRAEKLSDIILNKLPPMLNHIGKEAFSNCTTITRIEIPASVV